MTPTLPPGITIRAQTVADLPAIVKIRNAERSRWGTLSTPFESLESWRQRMAAVSPLQTDLVACANGEAVGMAGIFRSQTPRLAHGAGIGIGIRDDWQGKGLGTALFTALIDLADNWLGLRRLGLNVYTDNAAAIALYKKFGFVIEGTEIAEAYRAGAYTDSHFMGRLHGDLPRDTAPYPQPAPPAPAGPFILRAAEPEDLDAITALMQQPLVRYGTLRTPFTTPEENKYLVLTEGGARAIVATVDGTAIALGRLHPYKDRRAHMAEIAMLAVHDAWHGAGIGAAILSALLDTADNWLNLKRLRLHVMADNTPAITLYKKFGFMPEGLKRADVFRAGAYVDSVLMARLR